MRRDGAFGDFDSITVEVVRHRLEGIANEMEATLLKSSFSPIVKEGQDASASLFTVEGETLAQAIAIPIHLATLIPIVETIQKTYPLSGMGEGDIYIMNDPYLGGTHLPDIALVMPCVFRGSGGGVERVLDASPGCRRDDAGLGADPCNRGIPGRASAFRP